MKDNEVYGEGNSYTTEFRQYDPRICRWMSLDPLMQKYPDVSPYCAYLNNPILVIDVKGDSIKITGSPDFQRETLTQLQKLTNDKLILKDGIVYISIHKGANTDKDFKEGTTLIRELNKKGKGTNMIEIREGSVNHTALKSSKDYVKQLNKQCTGAIIYWNPGDLDGGMDVEGSKSRPTRIGLAHELEHGQDALRGDFLYDNDDIIFKDPETGMQDDAITVEEYNVQVDENKIRKEQGVPLRAIPEFKNTGSKPNTVNSEGKIVVD